MRVPVFSKNGKPLMPTKPARARKMIHDGVAKKCWSKTGVFYLQMLIKVGEKVQDMVLAIDPGSKYDGYAISGEKEVAKVQLRIKIVRDLVKIFPINYFVVEDVRFNHYQKRWGKFFSMVEIGKTMLYEELQKHGELITYQGWQTAEARKYYRIEKSSVKDALTPSSHANDAVAMLCQAFGRNVNKPSYFLVWRRLEFVRRSLHRQNFQLGHIRPLFGGTTNGTFFRKGDYVEAKQGTKNFRGWVCGLPSEKTKAVAVCNPEGKRLGQFSLSKVKLLRRNTGISWQFPPD